MISTRLTILLAALLAAGLTAIIAALPGYFAGDELQWGARGSVPWPEIAWRPIDRSDFQFRPLTLNAWLAISHFAFDRPILFHTVFAGLGLGVVTLLYAMQRKLEVGAAGALLGACLFILLPTTAFTHSWVGTLADLIWVASALTIAALALSDQRGVTVIAILAVILTAIGLAAKETGVAIPGLLLAVWALRPGTNRLVAVAGSLLAVIAYLWLRKDALMRGDTATYTLDLGLIPLQAIKYFAWPFAWKNQELHNLLYLGWDDVSLALAMHAIIVILLIRWSWRYAVAYLLAYCAALLPVVAIPNAYPHYLYASGVALAIVLAQLYLHGGWAARLLLALPLLALGIHSVRVVANFHDIAQFERTLTQSVAIALVTDDEEVRIDATSQRDYDLSRRLLADVPAVRNQAVNRRIVLCKNDELCIEAITGAALTSPD